MSGEERHLIADARSIRGRETVDALHVECLASAAPTRRHGNVELAGADHVVVQVAQLNLDAGRVVLHRQPDVSGRDDDLILGIHVDTRKYSVVSFVRATLS